MSVRSDIVMTFGQSSPIAARAADTELMDSSVKVGSGCSSMTTRTRFARTS